MDAPPGDLPLECGVRVLVVDDHQLVRTGLCALLGCEPDIEVCAEAADGAAGARLALDKRPDVILMDVAMPILGGVEATSQIVSAWPLARIVMLTAHSEPSFVRAAMAAGAWGYVLKDANARTIVQAVRTTCRGGRPMTAEIRDILAAEA